MFSSCSRVALTTPYVSSSSSLSLVQNASKVHTRRFAHTEAAHQDMWPSVRRLLTLNKLDYKAIKPTGPQGRVLKGDVLSFLKGGAASAPAQAAQPTRATTPSSAPSAPTKAPTSQATATSTSSYEDIPNNNIRVVIAKRLTESKTTIPHVYVSAECNIDKLLKFRAQLNAMQPIKTSVNDFVLKAAALALRDVPAMNVTYVKDSIKQQSNIDISVAVATDKGLITPIIKNTDKKGVGMISTELKDLANRAKQGKLKPDEFQGGSFSVSNLGMFGIKEFAAVINPPQAAILAIGTSRSKIIIDEPAPIAEESATKPPAGTPKSAPASTPSKPTTPAPSAPTKPSTPPTASSKPATPEPTTAIPTTPNKPSIPRKVVSVMDVTLSCDNRAIAEEDAAKFLTAFQGYVSNPERMLI